MTRMISKFRGVCKACKGTILPGTEIVWSKATGANHATPAGCDAARLSRQEREASAPVVDLSPILAFIQAAKDRGLKAPKLRVLSNDNRTELQMSLTFKGAHPGSLAVKSGGTFIGCVRPNGATTGVLATRPELHTHLLKVAADPAQAARDYAALNCRCSFCGLELTDAGSVEVGYGPVCAKHWGLPHQPKGVPALLSVDAHHKPTPKLGGSL